MGATDYWLCLLASDAGARSQRDFERGSWPRGKTGKGLGVSLIPRRPTG